MRASRFTFKLFAVLFSGFAEILYLDADNIALSNVTKLFQIYETTGVMLWKDFWLNSAAPDLFDVLPALRRNFCESVFAAEVVVVSFKCIISCCCVLQMYYSPSNVRITFLHD
jgi:alpha-N-acetylglucosamine transferase